MKKYKAIETFADNGTIYQKGDDYPKEGKAETERINYLLGNDNGFGRAVIEEVPKSADDDTTESSNGGYDY